MSPPNVEGGVVDVASPPSPRSSASSLADEAAVGVTLAVKEDAANSGASGEDEYHDALSRAASAAAETDAAEAEAEEDGGGENELLGGGVGGRGGRDGSSVVADDDDDHGGGGGNTSTDSAAGAGAGAAEADDIAAEEEKKEDEHHRNERNGGSAEGGRDATITRGEEESRRGRNVDKEERAEEADTTGIDDDDDDHADARNEEEKAGPEDRRPRKATGKEAEASPVAVVERPLPVLAAPKPSASRRSTSLPLIALTTGLSRKATPFSLTSWVSLALTLDGRDKLTKIVQYSSRLLGWYYETLSQSIYALDNGNGDAATVTMAGGNAYMRSAEYYARMALGWRSLQRHLTESRKAFRLGRGLIEIEKLRGMGWTEWIRWWLRRALLEDVEDEGAAAAVGTEPLESRRGRRKVATRRVSSNVGWGPTTTFGEDEMSSAASSSPNESPAPSRTPSPPRSALANKTEAPTDKRSGAADDAEPRVVAVPNRPRLPRRVSSNIGWGPLTSPAPLPVPPPGRRRSSLYRTASALGRWMYGPQLTSLASTTGAGVGAGAGGEPTPAWKLLFSTLKLLGLLGFWTADNLNYLHSSGFLDDHSLAKDDRLKLRLNNRGYWGRMGARSYFLAAVSGLVVSLREVMRHRGGKLSDAVHRVRELEERGERAEAAERRRRAEERGRRRAEAERRDSWIPEEDEDDDDDDDEDSWSGSSSDNEEDHFDEKELEEARRALKAAEGRQFTLFLALLKSCCDVIVFSNNPGIDLHKKYRGRKMNEGFHSLCGLISASTVIYNNFPNAPPSSPPAPKTASASKAVRK